MNSFTRLFWFAGIALVSAPLSPCSAQNPTWTQKQPANTPGPRTEAGVAFDAARGQTVLFGGATANFLDANDTWIWDGTNWSQKPTSAAPASRRMDFPLVYDSARQEVVLYGGQDRLGNFYKDTWVWDGSNWVNKTPISFPTNPTTYVGYAAAYDSARNQTVMFGGLYFTGSSYASTNETWVWNGSTWSNVTPASPSDSPSGRYSSAMAYDSVHQQIVLFGGVAGFNDTWTWNGIKWSNVTPTLASDSPPGRFGHSMVYDAALNKVVLFGGQTWNGALLTDTWAWDGAKWAQISSTGPAGRVYQSMTYDGIRSQIVLYGGNNLAPTALGDTWVFGGVQSGGCATVFQNDALAVWTSGQGTIMNATFTPNSFGTALTLSQAAAICGVINFDWQQTITSLPDPSPFYRADGVHITSSFTPFIDPPPGGWNYEKSDNAFPFYYDPYNGELLEKENTSTLSFKDNPADRCLPGGNSQGVPGCNGATAPAGSFLGFKTQLVGTHNDGTFTVFPLQWTWKDQFNGLAGTISITKGDFPVDANSGTGGITITSINNVPQVPPSVSCGATPHMIWPPNGKVVSVMVSGRITPGTSLLSPNSARYQVIDEYGLVQPNGVITIGSAGGYSFPVSLIAERHGNDRDGRTYNIVVTVADNIGNVGSCSAVVTVPHDQNN